MPQMADEMIVLDGWLKGVCCAKLRTTDDCWHRGNGLLFDGMMNG